MPQFASDTFSGTQFTELSAYSGVWSKQTGWTGNLMLGAGGTYMISNESVNAGVYQHSGSPINADYDVSATITKQPQTTTPNRVGVCARMQAVANTMYWAIYGHDTTNIRLFKTVASTQTQLGSSYTYTLSASAVLRLVVNGSSISVQLDGSTIIGPITDTDITAAGKAGVYGFNNRNTGVGDSLSLDNFSANDIAAPSALSGNVTLDNVAPAGTLADGGASGITGGVTLDPVLPAGTLSVQPGVITTQAFKSKFTGAPLAGVTIPKVAVLRVSDMATVLTLVDVATNGSGVLQISNYVLAPGQAYLVVTCNSDGSAFGAEAYTAA